MAEHDRRKEYWQVITSPKPVKNVCNTFKEATDLVARLRELGDESFNPTHILRVILVDQREEQIIALADPNAVRFDDVHAMVQEKLVKLGGEAPQGAEALRWVIEETLKAQSALSK